MSSRQMSSTQPTDAFHPTKLEALEQSHRDAVEMRRAIASKQRPRESGH